MMNYHFVGNSRHGDKKQAGFPCTNAWKALYWRTYARIMLKVDWLLAHERERERVIKLLVPPKVKATFFVSLTKFDLWSICPPRWCIQNSRFIRISLEFLLAKILLFCVNPTRYTLLLIFIREKGLPCPLIEGYWNNKNCHKIELYSTEFQRLTFSSRISPEFHHRQKKNELHLCNSLIFNVAGAGIKPATSWLWIMALVLLTISWVSPKVFSITPNRNLITAKVIFVTLGVLFLFDFSLNPVSVADRLGGDLTYDSAFAGPGSRFVLTLPM